LVDSRPRDALNTYDLRLQSGHVGIAPETIFGLPEDKRPETRTTGWNVHCYLHSESDVVPLDEDVFGGVQLGGKRNYGYGEVTCAKTRTFELSDIDFGGLDDLGGVSGIGPATVDKLRSKASVN